MSTRGDIRRLLSLGGPKVLYMRRELPHVAKPAASLTYDVDSGQKR